MQKLLALCSRFLTAVAAAAIASIIGLTTVDALGRYLLNKPVMGALQITEDFLLGAAIFLALAYSYRQGVHIRVTILVDRATGWRKLAMNYFAQIFSVLVGVALVFTTGRQVLDVFSARVTSSSLMGYPLWPAYLITFIGFFFMTLLLILDVPRVRTGTSSLIREQSTTSLE